MKRLFQALLIGLSFLLSNISISAASSNLIVVTSTADTGPSTFRQALAEATPGSVITFSPEVFPPSLPATITVSDQLTIGQDNIVIDASNAGVVLDGSKAPDRTGGLIIEASDVTVYGLQIVNFPGSGISIFGQGNTIGDNKNLGNGPIGQGNLTSHNREAGIALMDIQTSNNIIQGNLIGVDFTGTKALPNGGDGIHINGASHNLIDGNVIGGNGGSGIQGCCTINSSHNTITNNLIGIGLDGSPLPNGVDGVWFHDGASYNTVGPDNIIAYNNSSGVELFSALSIGNVITRNRIFANQGGGINLTPGANRDIAPASIMSFDLSAGRIWGYACPNCLIEIFSDQNDQGEAYEGSVCTDTEGLYYFEKGSTFAGPHLTVTVTDLVVGTSTFSLPTSGSGNEWIIQTNNFNRITPLTILTSPELEQNHFSSDSDTPQRHRGNFESFLDYQVKEKLAQGIKGLHIAFNEGEEPIDWHRPEFLIEPSEDAWIDFLNQNGIEVALVLNFWDKANHPDGWPPEVESRFTTEEEFVRYLEYVRFVVTHFKGRITYYDLWNEPDNNGSRIQYIEPTNFIELIRRTAPVIHEIDPEAKIMVGSVSYLSRSFTQDYLFQLVGSDVMPLIDVIAWHPMFSTSPEYEPDYYYGYPDLVRNIQTTAEAHGFTGTFRADEIYWRSPDCQGCDSSLPMHTDITAAKYLSRGITINLGLGVAAGGGTSYVRPPSFAMAKSLGTVFAGSEPKEFTIEVQSTTPHIATYTFTLTDGSYLVALWNDGVAVDDDPGTDTTVTLPNFAGYQAVAIDPLHAIEQPLITNQTNNSLVIDNFRLKDYPTLIHLLPNR